ncbi:hypothetical protein Taro_034798 [Colocasia esculenta]|uniref:Uncharacterized protein n=1 Tax=Colocasia esculenta TaxID=4460 RepID=A0A843W4Y2_COLES|nr:hypothetical protein [Colocasia esculenta]
MEQIKDEFEEGILRYINNLPEVQLSQFKRAISALAPAISHTSNVQLIALNEAQASEGKHAVSPATFLDMNFIHLVNDPFKVWEERYKVYVALLKALRDNLNHYPVTMDQFLSCASFGKSSTLRMTMDRSSYIDLLDKHYQLHLKKMAPTMGPNYSIAVGDFKQYFERQEEQAWETISHYASLLSHAITISL